MFRGLSTLARLTPAALAAPAVALCDEKSARGALADLIDKSEARRGDGTSLGPTMVRLAWHSAGTFCKQTGTGGSDGGRMKYCPESAWGANAGLADVRAVVEKVAQDHGLSRADAYTLAGVVAVGSSSTSDESLSISAKFSEMFMIFTKIHELSWKIRAKVR